MDAIWGWLSLDNALPESSELARIASLIDAKAPDLRIDRSFALAMSRKVVIPHSKAGKIFGSADGSIWVALTGKIDNREELLLDIANRGAPLTSELDAEIILHLFEEHGVGFAQKLQGLFNIVIWNAILQTVYLVCDKVGGFQSLYYYRDSKTFAFGSAIKAIVANSRVERAIDHSVLPELFLLGHPIAPDTLMRNIKVMTAGSYLEYRAPRLKAGCYWRREFRVNNRITRQELDGQYFDALSRSVRRAVDANGNLGLMLSGGVDSAALLRLMQLAGASRIRTFSIHIGDTATNDRAASQRLADMYGTQHCSIDDLDSSCLDLLPEMIWYYESAGQDFHPTYWLCREAAASGIDILIGGYGNDLVWGCCLVRPRGRLSRLLSSLSAERRFLTMRRRMPLAEVRQLLRMSSYSERMLLDKLSRFANVTGDELNDYIVVDDRVFGEQVVHRELGKFMIDAHSIWPRMPYLDAAVSAIADTVPTQLKMTKLGGHLELKYFFKELIHKKALLPDDIIFRKKTWMTSPTAEWLRNELRNPIETLLRDKHSRVRQYVDMARVESRLREHRLGQANHAFLLMTLTGLELFHRIFIDAGQLRKPKGTLPQIAYGDGQ